jgi:hypothetical protein
VTFDDYLADFSGQFHDLRGTKDTIGWLHPDTYVHSQALAEQLLDGGSLGNVYPSVRRAGGTCLVCFRPALVMHVRKGTTYRFRWSGYPTPAIAALKSVRSQSGATCVRDKSPACLSFSVVGSNNGYAASLLEREQDPAGYCHASEVLDREHFAVGASSESGTREPPSVRKWMRFIAQGDRRT